MSTANPADELFHAVGEHASWSESYYFNFTDPDTGVGAFTRMGFRPNDGWADALHAVYLPGGRVAFTYGRRTDLSPQSPSGSQAKAAGAAAVEAGCFLNWFSMNFGADLALGGACGRVADGTFRGKGWIQRNGVNADLLDVTMATEFDPDNPLLHARVQLRATDSDGQDLVVDGTVLTICPTKIPRRDGVTFVNEGLARFETAGRVGYGIAEHWHAVPR
jgi:hypothetical protein